MSVGDVERTLTMGAPSMDSDLPPGALVGRYVLLHPLGKGAMGAVYAAYDSELDRRVALKFLRARTRGPDQDDWRGRLMREAKAMARLSHPNVVTLYDAGLSSERDVFLAMEMVEGGTLRDWLRAAPRSWRQIVALLCEAGEGLAAAHRAGMIHRDFKPENVVIGKDGRPRVTDFGLARGTEGAVVAPTETAPSSEPSPAPPPPPSDPHTPPPSSSSLGRLTLTGAVMGTPGYMAPEQYLNQDIDARADIFAFCATLHRALYGERAFEGKALEEIAEATILGKVREAPKGSGVPPWRRAGVLGGRATHREDRPESLDALLGALRADPGRRRQRWLVAAGAVAATCVAALSVRAASERQVRACRAAADKLGGVWDGPRKEAIARAFHATGLGYADDTWKRVEARLDGYAASWGSATEAACRATRVRGEQSEAILDLRASCLDERLDELHALADAFAGADAKTVEKAVQAATSLPSLAPCSHPDELTASARLPTDVAARAKIRALQAEIAGANELGVTGRQTQCWERLQQLHERVVAAGYGPVVVAWTMAVAEVDIRRVLKAAAAEWESALTLAETYHLDRFRAAAEVGFGRALNELGQHEDAHHWLALARATIARTGGDPALELKRDVYEGYDYWNEAKYADAARVLEQGLARASADRVDDPADAADAQSFLGLALLYDDARFEEAVTHGRAAVAIDEEAYGPQHPFVGTMASNLAIVEQEVGRLDDALAAVSRSRAIYEAAVGRGELSAQSQNVGNASLNEGIVLIRMGRASEAAPLIERARAVYRANDERDGLVNASTMLAEAWRQLGRLEDAARACDEARVTVERGHDTDPEFLVELHVVEAMLALDRGRKAEALPFAERALSLAQTGASHLYDLSRARLALARALSENRADMTRARALVDQARDGFTQLRDRPRVEECEALRGAMR